MGKKSKYNRIKLETKEYINLKPMEVKGQEIFNNSIEFYHSIGVYIDPECLVLESLPFITVLKDGIHLYNFHENYLKLDINYPKPYGIYNNPYTTTYDQIKDKMELFGLDITNCFVMYHNNLPYNPKAPLVDCLYGSLEYMAQNGETQRPTNMTPRNRCYLVKNIGLSFLISFDYAPYVLLKVIKVYTDRDIITVNGDISKLDSGYVKHFRSYKILDLRNSKNIDLIRDIFKGDSLSRKQKALLNKLRRTHRFGSGAYGERGYYRYYNNYKKNNIPRRLSKNKPKGK